MNRHPDKRSRLVDAAVRLVHEQGFARTTLADIAGAAGVPLGNVYYYFKTKEAIGEALVAHHAGHYATLRGQWNQSGDARSRLAAFVQMTADNRAVLARSGCPVGTLCAELHKAGGPLAEQTGASSPSCSAGWRSSSARSDATPTPPTWPCTCCPHSRACR